MEYIAGDIGGTKTSLALFQDRAEKIICVKKEKYRSQDYPNFCAIARTFLQGHSKSICRGCFAIAGPVKGGTVQATNLPWLVDASLLTQKLPIEKVALINDLEANAYGIQSLGKKSLFPLNKGNPTAGNKALISAGTGLGEAGIFFDGEKDIPFACEGGHADFAPSNPLEDKLLIFLREKFTHVSYERVLSGPGLLNIYQFVVSEGIEREEKAIVRVITGGYPPSLISQKGLSGTSKACKKALDLFISIYGSEAGNMALKIFSLGGVYIGGGIAPKILSLLKEGEFLRAFTQKGRFASLLAAIPIHIILDDRAALLGALHYARYKMS